jgi:hypothetical protein
MVKVIIIEKGCNLKCSEIKNVKVDVLYKKCNFRKKDDFDKRHTWKMDDTNYVTIFSKNKGRANSENKYDLPPPVDTDLYYGSMLLLKHETDEIKNENVKDLTIEEWDKLYEKLFGGFEDLNEEDSYSEEEEIPEHLKTKNGYSKEGGFVVDDDEEEEEEEKEEDDSEEEYIIDDSEEEAHTSTDSADEDEEIMGKDSEIEEEDDEEDKEEDEDEDEEYDSDEIGSELSEESYVDSD